MAAAGSMNAMVTAFGTTVGYFEEAMFNMSFALAVWLSTLVCLLAPFGEWIWKRNNFRSRKNNLITWQNIFLFTLASEIALGFFWPYLTIETGGAGPMGGFFAALIALFFVLIFLIWRYAELKPWCGLLMVVAAIGISFLAVESISAEKAPRPSMGHIMRFVKYMPAPMHY